MSPKDPLFLAMSDEEIAIEFETVLCAEGEAKKTCPQCGGETFRKRCPWCQGSELTGDTLADDLFTRLEAGEDVDLSVLQAGQNISGDFVPVIPGEKL